MTRRSCFPPFVDFFPNFRLWPVPSLMLIGCAMGCSLRFLAQFSLLFGRTNLKALLPSNFLNILELSRVTYLYMVLIADVLLRVLLIIQQLLQESRHGSKRDIYYMHPTVFKGNLDWLMMSKWLMFQKTNLDWFLVFKCSYCQLISQTMVWHYLFVEFILKYSCDWLQSFSSKASALMYYGSSAFSVANVPWFRSLVQTI